MQDETEGWGGRKGRRGKRQNDEVKEGWRGYVLKLPISNEAVAHGVGHEKVGVC